MYDCVRYPACYWNRHPLLFDGGYDGFYRPGCYFAYPINRAAREMLYSAVLQEYDRLRSEEELRRQETKLQVS